MQSSSKSLGLPAGPYSLVGDVLIAKFLIPRQIALRELASISGYNYHTIYWLVRGRRQLSARMAEKFGELFNTSADFWLDLDTAASYSVLERAGYLQKR